MGRAKAELRNKIRQRDENQKGGSESLAKRVMASEEFQNAKSVFCYMSLKTEPETRGIISAALELGKTLAVPKCYGNRQMKALRITSLDQLKPLGYMGIEEPLEDCGEVAKKDIELAIIPAMCFDTMGYRLGRGGGYYDVYLRDFTGRSMGLCFENRLLKSIPHEDFDVPVDLIVTEKRLFIPEKLLED